MINTVLRILVALPGVLFVVLGLRWLVAPAGVAAEFGFPLSTGIGLSSQVGDMAGYFLTLGLCILAGASTRQRAWFYPAMMLLSLTAMARVLAWLMHDAAFAGQMIAVEVIVTSLLLLASWRLPLGK